MNHIETMKQALEALDCIYSPLHVREIEKVGNAMRTIRNAIAEAEKQGPVSIKKVAEERGINLPVKFVPKRDESKAAIQSLTDQCASLIRERDELQKQVWRYEKITHPQPKREWVGLTDEEVISLMRQFPDHLTRDVAKAIEAKLKEKNTWSS